MQPIAYTISPYLLRFLNRLESVRQQIILFPLSPKRELGLQFQATIERVHYGLALTDEHVHPEKIKTLLANQIVFAMQKKIPYKDNLQRDVLRYKQAIDYIKREWNISSQTISIDTILHLYSLTGNPEIKLPEKELRDIINYLHASADNPFTQAALAKLQFRRLLPDSHETELFSTMSSYIFLYQSGMSCRDLLILEKPWVTENKLFSGYYATSVAKPNVTGWLEYFIKTVCEQLETTYQSLLNSQTKVVEEKIGKLNERQKVIMTLLDDPQAIITNRTIQKIFHISPITASRDLTKLTMLGLLFQQGKGRSVRYTRI
jgi:Fic family protein